MKISASARMAPVWLGVGFLSSWALFYAGEPHRFSTAGGEGEAQMLGAKSTPSRGMTAPQSTTCHFGIVLARDEVDVTAQVEGQLDRVSVRVGDRVTRGQHLATFETHRLRYELESLQASLRTAEAEQRRRGIEVRRAEQEHRRRVVLGDLFSKEAIEAARFEHETALASAEAAEAEEERVASRVSEIEARIARSELRAPFDAGTRTVARVFAGTSRVSAKPPSERSQRIRILPRIDSYVPSAHESSPQGRGATVK